MKLPVFLSGLCAIVVLSVIGGIWAGFSTSQLVLFTGTVLVVVQLAYVILVAGLSALNRWPRGASTQTRISRSPSRLSRMSRENTY